MVLYYTDLQKLDGSSVVLSSTKTIAKYKGQLVTWPFHIKCGLCGVERQVDIDRKHSGIISKFKLGRLFYIHQRQQQLS